MKSLMSLIGVILIILGIVGFSYKYFAYNTEEKVAEIGSVKVTAEKENVVFITPTTSAIMLAAGILLVVVGASRRK